MSRPSGYLSARSVSFPKKLQTLCRAHRYRLRAAALHSHSFVKPHQTASEQILLISGTCLAHSCLLNSRQAAVRCGLPLVAGLRRSSRPGLLAVLTHVSSPRQASSLAVARSSASPRYRSACGSSLTLVAPQKNTPRFPEECNIIIFVYCGIISTNAAVFASVSNVTERVSPTSTV